MLSSFIVAADPNGAAVEAVEEVSDSSEDLSSKLSARPLTGDIISYKTIKNLGHII